MATQTVMLVDGEPAMTPSEVAALLGMTTERVRQLGTDGRLTAVGRSGQMRLYRRADVEAFAAQRHEGAMPAASGRRGRKLPAAATRRDALEARRAALCQERAQLADLAASVAAELHGVERALALLGHSADTVSSDNRITASEAATMLGVTPQRVRQLAEAGALAVVGTLGRARVYRRADVEQLAQRRADHA